MSTPAARSLIPAIPLNALAAIKDDNARIVLQTIIDGWQVRNGAAGDGNGAFVTRADLTGVTGASPSAGRQGAWPTFADYAKNFTTAPTPGAVVADVEASLQASALFQQLGANVGLLNQNLTAEQQARVAAVQAVADSLAAEVTARTNVMNTLGGAIFTLQTTTGDHADQLDVLGVWKTDSQNSITSLQQASTTQAQTLTQLTSRVTGAESDITSLNTTTGTQAQTLTSLSTRVGDAESAISTLNTTTGTQATSLQTLTVSLGQKANTYFQATAPTGTIATGSLWFDSDDNNKPYRWDETAWVSVDSAVSLAAVQASITAEQDARVSADNAITFALSSQYSMVDGSIASLNQQTSTLANSVSSISGDVTTLNSTVGGLSTSLQQEAEARSSADGTLFARYGVKIDANGYVSGYGLMSTANNAAPTSEFIVRADKFAIGAPSGPGITPSIPFTVLTTPDGDGNLPGVYMDMAIMKKAAITEAYIADASIDTLKLKENAVTIPDYATAVRFTLTPQNGTAGIATVEYRWSDTGDLWTTAELNTIRSAFQQQGLGYFTDDFFVSNPLVGPAGVNVTPLCVLNYRDYSGQPVLVFYDIESIGAQVGTPSYSYFEIYRIEEAAGGVIHPTRLERWYFPRSFLANPTLTGLSTVQQARVVTYEYESKLIHSVRVQEDFEFSGFSRDTPPQGKRWQYIGIFGANGYTVTATKVTTKLATLGIKK